MVGGPAMLHVTQASLELCIHCLHVAANANKSLVLLKSFQTAGGSQVISHSVTDTHVDKHTLTLGVGIWAKFRDKLVEQ